MKSPLLLLTLVAAATSAVESQPRSPAWKWWPRPPPNLDTPAPTPSVVDVDPAPTPSPTASEIPSVAQNQTNETPQLTMMTSAPTPNVTMLPETSTPEPTTPTPSPVPTTPAPARYVPPPIPVATNDSTTFRKVPSVVCDDKVANTIYAIYEKNHDLFDSCAKNSEYQIFPYSGTKPTADQIHEMATTKACTVLFTACVVANLPECDTSGISLKAVTETLLKITMDVEHGKSSPDTDRFHRMHIWRRDSNLAKAAGVPNGNDSALYAEFARDLPEALAKYSVDIKDDLTIVYTEASGSNSNRSYTFDRAAGSMAAAAGEVHANSEATDEGSGVDQEPSPSIGSNSSSSTEARTMSGALLHRDTHFASLGLVVFGLVIAV